MFLQQRPGRRCALAARHAIARIVSIVAAADPFSTGTLTFLLTDVEGSTTLWEEHPHVMSEAMVWHDGLVERIVQTFHGHVVKARGEGDSQFIVFTDAAHGVAAAVALQRALAEEQPDFPFDLKVRAGLHTGAAEWRDGDYYGSVVNRCARIRSLGHGGQTLLSEATANLVRDALPDGIGLVDKGTFRLKGLARPEKVFQVTVPGLNNEFPALQLAFDHVYNVPAPTTPLIGRERETKELISLLTQGAARLVTITGPGGTGKTRLALEVGSELQDYWSGGVCFVDLAPLAEPREIAPAIAVALNYQAAELSQSLEQQLLSSLGPRRLLLILDNFEHLLGGRDFVNDILHRCPLISILATSRQRLNLASETRYDLGGLALPPESGLAGALTSTAVQLFVDNARRTLPDFTVTHDSFGDVVRICQLVEGMPLGIVLAATWLEVLSPAEIAAEIEQSLTFLTAELVDLPARQRSMQAVFEGSWQFMPPDEQAVMARLSVFRGGFTREAAEGVAGASLKMLLALVNRSLLQRQPDSDRFTMHELLRQFAAGQREILDPNGAAEDAHCRLFAALVTDEIYRALFFYPINIAWRHGADRDNFHRALDFAVANGLDTEVVALIRAIAFFSINQGVPPKALVERAMHGLETGAAPASEAAMRHLRLCHLAAEQGHEDLSIVQQKLLAFKEEADASGDLELIFWTNEQLSTVFGDLQSPQAITYLLAAREVALQMQNETLARMAEAHALWLSVDLGVVERTTVARIEEMLPGFEEQFPHSFVSYGFLWALGQVRLATDAPESALRYGTRALAIAKRWQDLFWISHASAIPTRAYVQLGDIRRARQSLLEVLDWHLAIGQPWQTLGWLMDSSATMPQFIDDFETLAALQSMVYHHPASVAHFRERITTHVLPRLKAGLSPEVLSVAWERGRSLDYTATVVAVRQALESDVTFKLPMTPPLSARA